MSSVFFSSVPHTISPWFHQCCIYLQQNWQWMSIKCFLSSSPGKWWCDVLGFVSCACRSCHKLLNISDLRCKPPVMVALPAGLLNHFTLLHNHVQCSTSTGVILWPDLLLNPISSTVCSDDRRGEFAKGSIFHFRLNARMDSNIKI